jgi:tight adherence protein C
MILATLGTLLSLMGLWRIARREDRERRFAALYADALRRSEAVRAPARSLYRRVGTTFGTMLATSKLISVSEQRKLIAELAAAGLKGREYLTAFIVAKLFSGLVFVGLSWVYLHWLNLFPTVPAARVALMGAGFILGWRFPDLVLMRLAARRKMRLEQGFPDALDLLVVCVEVGLSLDQAIEEVARQLASSAPAVAEEFAATAAEMRVLSDRAQALENLAQRTDVQTLHSLVATLVQSVRFGTPLAESLRLIASEMRAERAAKIEERAARLPTLLMIPLMAFIFPALMFVIGTPLLIRILDTLSNIRWHGF